MWHCGASGPWSWASSLTSFWNTWKWLAFPAWLIHRQTLGPCWVFPSGLSAGEISVPVQTHARAWCTRQFPCSDALHLFCVPSRQISFCFSSFSNLYLIYKKIPHLALEIAGEMIVLLPHLLPPWKGCAKSQGQWYHVVMKSIFWELTTAETYDAASLPGPGAGAEAQNSLASQTSEHGGLDVLKSLTKT